MADEPNTPANPANPAATAAAPAAQPQAPINTPAAKPVEKPAEKPAVDVDAIHTDYKRQLAEQQFRNDAIRAAASAGVKDLDYVEYLIGRERAAKGETFNLNEFLTATKTARPDLFNAPQAATPASTTANPPATQQQAEAQIAKLNTDLEAARKARDYPRILSLETKLQELRAKGA
ncbi:hypothetical protein GC173_11510 [bacterium]|nr:hypothetical protein [bacterium]